MKKSKKIIILSGPTASFKTSMSLKVAKEIKNLIHTEKSPYKDVVIINFDSILFYKELNVGSAKPHVTEIKDISHYQMNISSVKDPINSADYVKNTVPLINKLHAKNKIVILVGGSGFYLNALLMGMYQSSTPPISLKNNIDTIYKNHGIKPVISFLKKFDSSVLERIHQNDHYRLTRALFHYLTNHESFLNAHKNHKNHVSNIDKYNWDVNHVYLNIPKDQHLDLINQRTKEMIKNGLIQEVLKILKIYPHLKIERPLNSIGYKETIEFIQLNPEKNWENFNLNYDNPSVEIKSLIDNINIATRKLAKAQRTWFNRINDKKTFNPTKEEKDIIQYILKITFDKN